MARVRGVDFCSELPVRRSREVFVFEGYLMGVSDGVVLTLVRRSSVRNLATGP